MADDIKVTSKGGFLKAMVSILLTALGVMFGMLAFSKLTRTDMHNDKGECMGTTSTRFFWQKHSHVSIAPGGKNTTGASTFETGPAPASTKV